MSDADMGPVKRYERDWMDWETLPKTPTAPKNFTTNWTEPFNRI